MRESLDSSWRSFNHDFRNMQARLRTNVVQLHRRSVGLGIGLAQRNKWQRVATVHVARRREARFENGARVIERKTVQRSEEKEFMRIPRQRFPREFAEVLGALRRDCDRKRPERLNTVLFCMELL